MKNETVQDFDIAVTNEHRLMALLALTAQELPSGVATPRAEARGAQTTAVDFNRLDADPAQLEDYLRRGMRPQRAQFEPESSWRVTLQSAITAVHSWLTPVRAGVVATMSAALIAVSLLSWQGGSRESLADIVANSYSAIDMSAGATLVLPWERGADALGFAPTPGNDTPAGRAFARGLLRGRARLTSQVAAFDATSRARGEEAVYETLGEWNVLMWAAAQSATHPTGTFWRDQSQVARRMARASFSRDDAQAIEDHLALVAPLLSELAEDGQELRTKRRLAEELTRFREAFAPHNSTEPAPAP